LILSFEQYWLRSTKQRLDTLKSTCFVIRQNVSKFGVLNTLFIGLEVNADKTKYMIMSRDQNAG